MRIDGQRPLCRDEGERPVARQPGREAGQAQGRWRHRRWCAAHHVRPDADHVTGVVRRDACPQCVPHGDDRRPHREPERQVIGEPSTRDRGLECRWEVFHADLHDRAALPGVERGGDLGGHGRGALVEPPSSRSGLRIELRREGRPIRQDLLSPGDGLDDSNVMPGRLEWIARRVAVRERRPVALPVGPRADHRLDRPEPLLDHRNQLRGPVGLVGDGDDDRALGMLARQVRDDLLGHEPEVLSGRHVHAHPETQAVARPVGADRDDRVLRREAEQRREGVDEIGDVVGREDRDVVRHHATIVSRLARRQVDASACGRPPADQTCGCRSQ